MYYNPTWIEGLTVKQCAALICHELLHLLRDHAGRADRAGIPMTVLERRRWNIAADMEINDDLAAGGWELPPDGVQCADAGLPEGRLAEWYYAQLLKNAPQQSDGTDGEGGDTWQKGPMRGECGGAAGNPHPCEGDASGNASEGSDNSTSDEGAGCTPAELDAIRRATAEAVRRHKHQGRVPAGLERWAEEQLAPPQIPWQERLQRMTARAVTFRSGPVDYTWTRPSRRQAAVGYGFGRPVLPRMRQPEVEVAFVLDTSGSMSGQEILSALSEAEGILRATAGQLDFVACDAEVHELQSIRSVHEARKLIKGGGGTSFIPAFEALERRRPRPKVVVYATDGYGSAPAEPPRGMDVIWLLVGSYTTSPADWGEVIEVTCEP
jgi:predicted metal-dependent peptidase